MDHAEEARRHLSMAANADSSDRIESALIGIGMALLNLADTISRQATTNRLSR